MANGESSAQEQHHEAIRQEYTKQAPGWATSKNPAHLQWVVDNLELQPHFEVLDVAAGTGLLGRAIAPYVSWVVASDITVEMLARGRGEIARTGIKNLGFEQGIAEDLPYPEASFDMTVTRFSVHHFLNPATVLAEMRRVCRPGGKVVVIDMVAPEEAGKAARYNDLERIRDRTHTRAVSARELNKIIRDAGLEITDRHSHEVEVNAEDWLDSAQVAPTERERIVRAMNEELDGSDVTGLRPFLRGDEFMFVHTWEMVVAEKKPDSARIAQKP